MPISRRKFIQVGSLASASLMLPQFLRGFQYQAPAQRSNHKILVVIQLSGGNDGLNTVVPYRNDIYYKSRPTLALPADKILTLTDDTGLNPALKGLKQQYDDGHLSIINGVGYPDPNRSHFRSMDIWQTGSTASEMLTTGWLGRYLDTRSAGQQHNALAIEVDDTLSLALKGDERSALAVQNIETFHAAATTPYFKKIASHADEHEEKLAGYLYKTLAETTSASDYLYQINKVKATGQTYPTTGIGKRLKTIGALINADAETQVYYVSHGSFDTHVGQADRQTRLFTQLDDALTPFIADLKANGKFEDVLIMTFSEFGRRVEQNASNGTDHGTAGSMFMIGGSLKKPGLYNPLPNLSMLDAGDLEHSIDFKQVYTTVLEKWLQADGKAVLGRRYTGLDFI